MAASLLFLSHFKSLWYTIFLYGYKTEMNKYLFIIISLY
jgi:hypothetical protein